MHIVVVTKATPDTGAKITVEGGRPTWKEEMVINPWDEYSVTKAVMLKEEHNAKVTVITIGPAENEDALKRGGLAIGADEAIRVWDDALVGHDSLQYARVLAAAIQKLGDVTLVIFGKEFADSGTNQHIYQTARKLGFNVLGSVSNLVAIDFGAGTLSVERSVEQGKQTVSSKLPAVIGVLKDIAEPRYASFMNIRKAAKAQIPVWSLADLGLEAGAPKVTVGSYTEPPKQEGEVELIEGASAREIAEKLAEKLLEDKVL